MEASIAIGVQAVPVNKQEYNPYRRLYMQVTSHHVIFNHQDLLLQLVSIKINSKVDISTFSLYDMYLLNIMYVLVLGEQFGSEEIIFRHQFVPSFIIAFMR